MLLIAIWALAAAKFGPNVIPTPTATFVAASRLIAEGRLISALSASLSVYLTGYVAAVLVAIPLIQRKNLNNISPKLGST